MVDIRGMNLEELTEYVETLGEKAFRAKQLYEWIHVKLARSFDEMTNLSAAFREKLSQDAVLQPLKKLTEQISSVDDTSKYLFELADGNVIESVCMRYHHGLSVCISSQVGCKMGCRFCASTLGGLVRNLTASEMLSQIYEIQLARGERISNVIVMGIGEPMDNFDNIVRFLDMISNEKGLNISQRNLTISTCGIVEKIRELADMQLQITLAISLHAPSDAIRQTIMPVANKYSMEELLDACRYYINQTGRRITFEYSMIEGVNDRPEDAKLLADKLHGMNAHVNLIPLNPVTERSCKRSQGKDIQRFKIILEKNRINVTIRREMGSDIDAACGQLRKKHIDESSSTII